MKNNSFEILKGNKAIWFDKASFKWSLTFDLYLSSKMEFKLSIFGYL